MKSAYSIFKEIENTSGKNDKIAIIKANSDNSEFKEYLKFLYDDMIVTGLSSKKIGKEVDESFDTYFEDEIEVMNYLRNNNTGRDIDIANVQNFIDSYLSDDRWVKFLEEVFTKSYKCGITSSSVNKAIPDLIPTFSCQLAHPYEKHADKVKSAFYLTIKLDGHRTLAFVEVRDGKVFDVKFRTRKGHEIFGLSEIRNDITSWLNNDVFSGDVSIVLDGEITILDDGDDDVFQKTSKIIRTDGEKSGLKFHVFDWISQKEFFDGDSVESYKNRRAVLDMMFRKVNSEVAHVLNVPVLYHGDDINEIAKWSNWATDNGHEGIMLNIGSGLYKTKRTSDLLKVKKFHNADVKCVDVFIGGGKCSNTLGGITIDYKSNLVNVGSGFTDEERDYYWNNKDEIIGKIVDIQFFEESTNQKDDGISLRFPTFKSVRSDKTEDDINYD